MPEGWPVSEGWLLSVRRVATSVRRVASARRVATSVRRVASARRVATKCQKGGY